MIDEIEKNRLKNALNLYVKGITEKSKGANMYICPLCGSGKGKNHTGAFSIYENGQKWKCHACGKGGDIFDLIGELEGIADIEGQIERAREIVGGYFTPADRNKAAAYTHQHTHNNTRTTGYTGASTDFTTFFEEAHKHINETDYPLRRGLSPAVVDRFNLGYVAEWRHPNAPSNTPASPRLIIPTSRFSYLARDTREDIPEQQKAYSKSKAGALHLFNADALQTATKPVFIVEGEIDALSIIEVGGEAVALGTTSKVKALLDMLKTTKPSQPLIIALDNDEAGEKASSDLAKGLAELNIPFYRYNPAGQYKDANEALQNDRGAIAEAVEFAEHIPEEEETAKREAYKKTSAAGYLQDFINGIAESVNTPAISTGFAKLDEALEGGLYEGLYIVGAISSLGKTTLLTQITDQIAQAGQDVLIFSLEMARSELIAKSISRHTLQIVIKTGEGTENAKTTRGITTGKRYERYSQREREIIKAAAEAYGEYAQQIYISEGIGDIGAAQIREAVAKHTLFTGKAPVVVIDYLQILAPYNDRATDKQNTDKAVMELKRISRDYKTPVIGISSFNRANYKEAVTMEAFKESGAIEYSSDVLIGLQLAGAGSKDFDATTEKTKDPREIELVILKNRNGRTGAKIAFRYYPLFNYFEETDKGTKDGDGWQPVKSNRTSRSKKATRGNAEDQDELPL